MRMCYVLGFQKPNPTYVRNLWSLHLFWVTIGLKHLRVNSCNNSTSESEKGSIRYLLNSELTFSLQNISAVTVFKWTVFHQCHHKSSLKIPELLTTGMWVTALMTTWLCFEITARFSCFIIVCPSPGTTFAQELLRPVNIVSVLL